MKLYKYTSLDSAIKILESGKILFNCPLNFNDPFDSRPYFSDEDIENIKRYLRNIFILKMLKEKNRFYDFYREINLLYLNMSKDEKINFKIEIALAKYLRERHILMNSKIDLFSLIDRKIEKANLFLKILLINLVDNKKFKDSFCNKLLNRFSVLCLSAVNNETLMWSHYANQHKGVCFEFDDFSDKYISKINYSTKRPLFNYENISSFVEDYNSKKINDEDLKKVIRRYYKFLYVKAPNRSYEKEYRIFAHNLNFKENNGFLFLKCPSISKIYFGVKFLENNKDLIAKFINIIKDKGISYVKFKESSKSFKLIADKEFKF